MELNEYQINAKKTAIFPGSDTPLDLRALNYATLGLVGEAGELANKLKKVLRGDKTLTESSVQDMCAELGDVLWYTAILASALGSDMESIATKNINKLLSRKSKGTIMGDGDNR